MLAHLSEIKDTDESLSDKTLLDETDIMDEKDLSVDESDADNKFIRGWMTNVLFTRHVGFMWDSVEDLDLPMVVNVDYKDKQKHARKAHRKKALETKASETKKALETKKDDPPQANVHFPDRLLHAQMKSMEYESLQSEWESGMAMLGMQSTGLKEEISTLQFMMSHAHGADRATYIKQMAELLKQQKEMRQSYINHSSKRPKPEKMDIMSGSTIDVTSSPGDSSFNTSDQVSSVTAMK
mmetsp:Transcript_5102/g.7460  ORF Transcript_5102/g.7460 Transcript_5102/m.7460 type:complete len:239 (-) Transcript_5102:30-746(-)